MVFIHYILASTPLTMSSILLTPTTVSVSATATSKYVPPKVHLFKTAPKLIMNATSDPDIVRPYDPKRREYRLRLNYRVAHLYHHGYCQRAHCVYQVTHRTMYENDIPDCFYLTHEPYEPISVDSMSPFMDFEEKGQWGNSHMCSRKFVPEEYVHYKCHTKYYTLIGAMIVHKNDHSEWDLQSLKLANDFTDSA
jgi:hypothetical protein